MHTYFNTLLLAFTALTSAYPSSSSSRYQSGSETKSHGGDDTIAFLQGLTNNQEDKSGRRGDPPEKYFHESTFHAHYDGRFAYTILPHTSRVIHLRALVRSYLSTMHELGAETWIMHGSLLGWWWNRQIMPWDDDIDVQVSEPAISFLAQYHNMTIHSFNVSDLDMSPEDQELMGANVGGAGAKGKRYLLEVNPSYKNASTTDWMNVIDARWIDIDTGLFIDITTLRVDRRPAYSQEPDEEEDSNDEKEKENEEVDAHIIPAFEVIKQRRESRRSTKFLPKDASAHSGPQRMYCKDKHRFLSSQIYPLRTSVFEGVPVRIPYGYQELLIEEYGAESLTETEFWKERYEFQQGKLEWVPMTFDKVQQKLQDEERRKERNTLKALKWSEEQERKRKMRKESLARKKEE